MDVLSGSMGNRTIELRDNSGTILESVTVNIPASTNNQPVTITLNMPIPIGTGLQLGTAAGSSPNLYRNNSGAVYPYTSANGVISLTGTTATVAGYYYFYYNWEVELPGCESDRIPVEAEVFPDFNLDINNIPGVTCTYQSGIQLSSNIAGGSWSANCVNCIDANTGVFEPSQAGVGAWAISYTASSNCEKTVTEYIVVETCLSIEENAIQEVAIFPNPSRHQVTISCNPEVVKTVMVTDVSGKIISQQSIHDTQQQIMVNSYENGLYFFNFLNHQGQQLTVKKFVKQ